MRIGIRINAIPGEEYLEADLKQQISKKEVQERLEEMISRYLEKQLGWHDVFVEAKILPYPIAACPS